MLNYNSYTSPKMEWQSKFESVLGHKIKICPLLEVSPKFVVPGIFNLGLTMLD